LYDKTLENKPHNFGNISTNNIQLWEIPSDESGFTNNCYIYAEKKSSLKNLITKVLQIRHAKSKFEMNINLENGTNLHIGRRKDIMKSIANNTKLFDNQKEPCLIEIEKDNKLSKHHCIIANQNDKCRLLDVGALNGCYKKVKENDKLKLNKNLSFFFLNIEFTVKCFSKDNNNNLYIEFYVGNKKEPIIQISNKECEKSLSFSPKSINETVSNLFSDACQKIKLSPEKYKENFFPKLEYNADFKKFYVSPPQDKSICDLLIKLQKYTDDNEYMIEMNVDDTFVLGGDTLITVAAKSLAVVDEKSELAEGGSIDKHKLLEASTNFMEEETEYGTKVKNN